MTEFIEAQKYPCLESVNSRYYDMNACWVLDVGEYEEDLRNAFNSKFALWPHECEILSYKEN